MWYLIVSIPDLSTLTYFYYYANIELRHVQGNMQGSRGGGAAVGFLSNIGPDSLEITKLPSQHSMLGHQRPASVMPFKWHFVGEPMMARFKFSDNWVLSPPHELKYVVKAGQNFLDPRMSNTTRKNSK